MKIEKLSELDSQLAHVIQEGIDDYFEKGHPDDSIKFEVSGEVLKKAKEADPHALKAAILQALATVEERHAPED